MAELNKKQYIEGELFECAKNLCECSCCDDIEVEEWVNEYFAFHERMKDYINSIGINIEFIQDRVRFMQCSDGKYCKFLKHSLNKDIDARPIDCKIYPFVIDWKNIDFDKKIANLYYCDNDCPLTKNKALPDSFKKEVEMIIKRDFAILFCGTRFKVNFFDRVCD